MESNNTGAASTLNGASKVNNEPTTKDPNTTNSTSMANGVDTRDTATSMKLSAKMAQFSELWNRSKNSVNYSFLPGNWVGTAAQHKKVRDSLDAWEIYSDIYFKEVSSATSFDRVTNVTIAFDPSPTAGSWSLVGTDGRAEATQATMNLGWLDPNSDTLTSAERATILHEFGHVLGMLHESQSTAGGGVALNNVDAAMRFYGGKEGWEPEEVRKQIIKTYNEKDVSSFSQADRKSIMQWPMPGSVTGLPNDGDYNYVLSDMDKAYMKIMYPQGTASPNAELNVVTLDYTGITCEDPISTNEKLRSSQRIYEHERQSSSSQDNIDLSARNAKLTSEPTKSSASALLQSDDQKHKDAEELVRLIMQKLLTAEESSLKRSSYESA